MLSFQYLNPYILQDRALNFLTREEGPDLPNLVFTPTYDRDNRYPIRILIIGIPEGVNSIINELYIKQFAETSAWSPAINSRHPGEIMKVMTRYFVINN